MSSRLGRPKLLLEIGGRSLIRLVVDSALRSKIDELVVVLGAEAEAVRQQIGVGQGTRAPRVVENPRFELGQSTSLRAGLTAVDQRCEAALFLMGDQPLVTPEIINALIDRYRVGDVLLVYPSYAGQRGTPVLFSRELFPELMRVTGDRGGREVLAKYLPQAASVDLAYAEAALDVDTWQDYAQLRDLGENRR